ncbi:MAG: NCS2 family permease [Streptococcaceae bacterium]|jgi:AGZA family xanthine/uracil permease-like MFS transporter|nr:NCS2 family permease [Streptococcaceae bacterium]
MLENFFKLKENNTDVTTEFMAGLTTFFAMSYIIFVNPSILHQSGMPFQGVFLATVLASIVGTLFMGLFANVPYAQAPGMGMNAFFTYTVVLQLGYTWQEALAMVFITGIINILITVTNVRKMIIHSIPEMMQHAIGGGIGIFVAYVGLKNAGLMDFTIEGKPVNGMINGTGIVPSLTHFNNPAVILGLIGILLTTVLVIKNIKGAILISIVATTLIAIPMGVVDLGSINWSQNSLSSAFSSLGDIFGAAFGSKGMGTLFATPSRIPQVILTILAFSLAGLFDAIGTFIGTGRRTGIFSQADEQSLEGKAKGIHTKLDRALFSDAIATTAGAVFGTSNVTTFVESAAGIGAGGRTGLTSIFTSIMFALSALLAPLIALVPNQATAPALILVGAMMLASFKDIDWRSLDDAVPAFFASIFMGLSYSINTGLAAGFIFYTLIKVVKGNYKEITPMLWIIDILFVINFVSLALI